ncbi:MAG TPA: efflux RND transporter periplasmic adaptor subunit [Polyangiaceae bacterium]|nr:efflux RND transporter periplasmic adaptor subunit [Polyangiaceae bacterium]
MKPLIPRSAFFPLHSRPALSVILLVGLSVSGCKREDAATRPEKPAGPAAESGVRVRFVKVQARRVPPVLELTGALEAEQRSEVAAQTSGVVSAMRVDVGSRVKKGDVLAVLESSEAALRLSVAQATAEQQKARLGLKNGDVFEVASVADVRSAEQHRNLKVKEAERARSLAADGVISSAALDQATTAAEQAEAQLDAARNGAEQAWAGLNAARAQARLSQKALGDTRVLAPFEGAVVERRISVGEFAQVGRVIAVVLDDNPLRLRMDVPEADVGHVSVGKDVSLRVAAFPGRDFRAAIARVGASVHSASRTLPIEADVTNADGLLRPGFFATARVALAGPEVEALFVPRSAVGISGSSARVFVRTGNRVSEKLVVTGRNEGELVEVRGSLSASDEVAVEGVEKLSDSQPVAAR